MSFNFFFSKLLPLEVENKPRALISCTKANVSQLLPVGTCTGASHLKLYPAQPEKPLGKNKGGRKAFGYGLGIVCSKMTDVYGS